MSAPTRTESSETTTSKPHLHGLDVLRLLAAMLVFLQHTLSCSGHDEWIDFAGFRIGRIGTAIFFMLGGFLAATSRRPAVQWFFDRLRSLLPTFWVVTGIGFVLAAIGGRKEFDAWQVLCQFSGLGYFTHGERLINIATWFMSPLILLYATVAVVKLKPCRWLSSIITLVLLIVATRTEESYATIYCHGVVFFLTYSVCTYWPKLSRNMTPTFPLGLIALSMIQPEFRYGAAASILLTVFMRIQSPSRIACSFSRIAYEWFLVHGICLSIAMRVTQSPVRLGLLGAILSLFVATGLRCCFAALSRFRQHWIAGIADETLHPDPAALGSPAM